MGFILGENRLWECEFAAEVLGGQKIVGPTPAKVGQGKAFKEGWIRKDGDKLVKKVGSTYP
jgi:hypothetical protein